VADRTLEHLGESDRGVILMRKRLLEDAQAVAAGGTPKGLVRDPALSDCVGLPIVDRERLRGSYTLAEADAQNDRGQPLLPREFQFQAGQPEAIRQAYRKAMGIDRG
jgi:5,5'-dehydrodivanillate O-demethylase